MSWSSWKKKHGIFCTFIFSKENFFNICVLSRCIVCWINLRNIHTFIYQKTLLLVLYCLFSKPSRAFSVSLKSSLTIFLKKLITSAKSCKSLGLNPILQYFYEMFYKKTVFKTECGTSGFLIGNILLIILSLRANFVTVKSRKVKILSDFFLKFCTLFWRSYMHTKVWSIFFQKKSF